VPAQGRSTARINGRAVVQSALRSVGARLVDIHGQEDQQSIFRVAEHLTFLDRYARLGEQRSTVAGIVGSLRAKRSELARLTDDERERARRQDRLRFEVEEIAAAKLTPEEEEDLREERTLLGNAEELRRQADTGYAALTGGEDGGSAVDALGVAADALAQLAVLDPRRGDLAEQAAALQAQADDLAREVRSYVDGIESDPERLQEIEERLALIASLKRKYGQTIREVLDYGARAAEELASLESSEERSAALSGEIEAVMLLLGEAAAQLSQERREAAVRLAAAVQDEIAVLGLADGRFAVHVERPDAAEGVASTLPADELLAAGSELVHGDARSVAFDRTGIDRVEFYASLNPGEPPRPLARVASGGESARLMLALKTILGTADSIPTLVFDEVDVGIGGRSGQVVGEKLAALGDHHQVLCITHLPQVAARARHHFVVQKSVTGGRTATAVDEVTGEERLRELAAMLGGVTQPNLQSAEAMLRAADESPSRRR
jgi:DNA repair protein RecN (Recombination protein N)